MTNTIKLGDKEYSTDNLSDNGKVALASFQFTRKRIKELRNMHALLQRAKNSYIDGIKKEVLSSKAGLFINEE